MQVRSTPGSSLHGRRRSAAFGSSRHVLHRLHAASPVVAAPVAVPKQQTGVRILQSGEGEASGLPTARGRLCLIPLLGEVLEVDQKGAFNFSVERLTEFGPVFSWKLGSDTVTEVVDFDAVKALMAQDGKVMVGWNPEAFYAMLGENTRRIMTNPTLRMAQRKFLAPGFTERATSNYIQEIVDICRDQLDAWAAAGQVELTTQAKGLSFEFSTRLLVKFQVPEEAKRELRRQFDDIFRALTAPAINLPGTKFWKGIQAKGQVLESIKQMVANTPHLMAQIDAAKASAPATNTAAAAATTSVFDTMLLARQETERAADPDFKLGLDDVAQAGIGLIIAGNDTSGLGIMGLMGMLPMFPQVMQKVRQEQEQVMAAHGPTMSRAALEAMPYTEAVVKEVLRVLPPARGIFRKTTVDLEVNGTFIPAGSILMLNFHLAQMLTDPAIRSSGILTKEQLSAVEAWAPYNSSSLSQEFNPDRWLQPVTPEAAAAEAAAEAAAAAAASAAGGASGGCPLGFGGSGNGNGSAAAEPPLQAAWAGLVDFQARPSGLLTFGVGPHMCLGMGLFYLEAKVLLALLARDYTLGLEGGSPAFTYSFFPELKQETVVSINRRAAAA